MQRFLLAWLLLCSCTVSPITFAAEIDESVLQMLYLRNFIAYSEWPDHHRPAVLAVMGEKPLKATLSSMQQQHALSLQTIDYCNSIACAKGADVLFIGHDFTNTKALLAAVDGRSVLTVSNQPGFIEHGGMIGMFRRNHRLRFAVNLQAVDAAHLHISAELLQMATRVIGGERP